MILVEISVPCFCSSYDFSVDENVPVGTVIAEVTSAIFAKERRELVESGNIPELYDAEKGRPLNMDHSLCAQGVESGRKLILI